MDEKWSHALCHILMLNYSSSPSSYQDITRNMQVSIYLEYCAIAIPSLMEVNIFSAFAYVLLMQFKGEARRHNLTI